MQTLQHQPSRALRLSKVCDLIGYAPATVWRKVKNDPTFPKPFRLGENAVAWDESELLAWLEQCKATREAA